MTDFKEDFNIFHFNSYNIPVSVANWWNYPSESRFYLPLTEI